MERKIGEVFNDGTTKLEVVIAPHMCDLCFYDDKFQHCSNSLNIRGVCARDMRSDRTSVIFKEVNETYSGGEDEIVCPYCGCKMDANEHLELFEDSGLEFDDEEIECDECERTFNVSRQVSFYYDTHKKDDV